MLRNFSSDKINCAKMLSFFFCELQLIIVLLLICDFSMSWSTRFVSLKLCVGFSIFDSVSFLLKFIFLFNKKKWKRQNSIKNQNNRKATQIFALRLLIFKLQEKVWKFSDNCVSWSSPKTDLVTNFLNLQNRSFENVSFFQ